MASTWAAPNPAAAAPDPAADGSDPAAGASNLPDALNQASSAADSAVDASDPEGDNSLAWNLGSFFEGAAASSDPTCRPPASPAGCGDAELLPTPLDRHAREASLEYDGDIKPDNDAARISHLESLKLLDSPRDDRYDSITQILAKLLSVPVAIITHISHERMWNHSIVGWDVAEMSRMKSVCTFLLLPREPEMLVSANLTLDPRFQKNPNVGGATHLRSYMGAPLIASNGFRIGVLCLLDMTPRYHTVEDCVLLANFAELGMREVEAQFARGGSGGRAVEATVRPQHALESGTILVQREFSQPESWTILYASTRVSEIWDTPGSELVGRNLWDLVTLTGPPGASVAAFKECMDSLADFEFTAVGLSEEGRKKRLSFAARVATAPMDDMAHIAVPADLPSEESALDRLYFLTVADGTSQSGSGWKRSTSGRVRRSPSALLQKLFEPEEAPGGSKPWEKGVIFLDRDTPESASWRVTLANEAAARMLGRTASELSGESLDGALRGSGGALLSTAVGPALAGRSDFSFTAESPVAAGHVQGVRVAARYCSGVDPDAASDAEARTPGSPAANSAVFSGRSVDAPPRARSAGSCGAEAPPANAAAAPRGATPFVAGIPTQMRSSADAPDLASRSTESAALRPGAPSSALERLLSLPRSQVLDEADSALEGWSNDDEDFDDDLASEERAAGAPAGAAGSFVWCLHLSPQTAARRQPPPPVRQGGVDASRVSDQSSPRSATGAAAPRPPPPAAASSSTPASDAAALDAGSSGAQNGAPDGARAHGGVDGSVPTDGSSLTPDVVRVHSVGGQNGAHEALEGPQLCLRLGRVLTHHLHGVIAHALPCAAGQQEHDLIHIVQASAGDGGCSDDRIHRLIAASHEDNRPELAGFVLRTAAAAKCTRGVHAVAIRKTLETRCLGNLRTLMHGNAFKVARGRSDISQGIISIDYGKVFRVVATLADALTRIHAAGGAHGEVTDVTVLLLCPTDGSSDERPFLCSAGITNGLEVALEDAVLVRDDYLLYFAPERYEALYDGPVAPGTAAADVWSLGVLMLALVCFSLPIVNVPPPDLLELAQTGRLVDHVAELSSLSPATPAAYLDLARRCLEPRPERRPSAGDVLSTVRELAAAVSGSGKSGR